MYKLIMFKTKPIGDVNHVVDLTKLNVYDNKLKEYMNGRYAYPLMHVLEGKVNPEKVSRLLNMSKTKEYERRQNTFKPELHWGQLKLFLSEVEFLTKVMNDSEVSSKNSIVFIYAGAAPGHHINYLHGLFPKIRFELYDPNDFVVRQTISVKTHVQFFMDVDAKYWRDYVNDHPGTYLAFCSDIRTEPATDENIRRNMAMQLEWWKIMNPDLSMFKFRLPWESGKTEYPEGEIYIQAYPGPTSTETRLIVKKDAKIVEYDNKQYESACFYHNTVDRQLLYKCILGNSLDLERDGLDNCYDCVSFVNIMADYLRSSKLPITGLRELIKNVQDNITFGKHNVKSQTKKHFHEALLKFKKMTYVPCGTKNCKICTSGDVDFNPLARGISKATIANEVAYVSSIKDSDLKDL